MGGSSERDWRFWRFSSVHTPSAVSIAEARWNRLVLSVIGATLKFSLGPESELELGPAVDGGMGLDARIELRTGPHS